MKILGIVLRIEWGNSKNIRTGKIVTRSKQVEGSWTYSETKSVTQRESCITSHQVMIALKEFKRKFSSHLSNRSHNSGKFKTNFRNVLFLHIFNPMPKFASYFSLLPFALVFDRRLEEFRKRDSFNFKRFISLKRLSELGNFFIEKILTSRQT